MKLLYWKQTDASHYGIGAVLSQKGRPIAFLSKAIAGQHLGYSTYEKELMVVVHAVNKWRHYLLGNKVLIKTDHQSLKYLLDQRITTTNQQKWITKLMGMDYEIIYRKGKENVVADSLSREVPFQLDKTEAAGELQQQYQVGSRRLLTLGRKMKDLRSLLCNYK